MDKPLVSATTAVNAAPGTEVPRPAATPRGQEKYTFLYVAISAVAVACAIAFSFITGLPRLQSVLLTLGCLIVACAMVFSFLEVRRSSRYSKTIAEEEAVAKNADEHASGPVAVSPPTGEPYPHHEYFTESQGFDQGQLTARIPDSTPFIEGLLNRRHHAKQKA